MADLKSIISNEISEYIGSHKGTTKLSSWYVGITGQDPDKRKKQHESEKNIICQYFKSWNVFQEYTAREIEKEIARAGVSMFTEDLDIVTASASGARPEYYVYVYLAVENERAKDK
ncbi:MAG: hypothetical protein PUC11_02400 [Elusimicrobia bacterium]|nr:hypothetical protein [Elusimicrobiota bacterium]